MPDYTAGGFVDGTATRSFSWDSGLNMLSVNNGSLPSAFTYGSAGNLLAGMSAGATYAAT